MTADDSTRESIAHALLTRIAADAADGVCRSDADYAAMFPGYEDLVLAELRALAADGDGAPARSPDPLAMPRIGHYELRRLLGRGGQATVYLARDLRLGRDVALKVLSRQGANVAQELRLQREASMAARLDDPGICPVHEVGRDGDHLFLAMKFVAGRSLAEQLRAVRPADDRAAAGLPPVADSLRLLEQLAGSLQRAHDLGIVHRDLKPANVMVTPDGLPVLLDFGLAIAVDDEAAPLTRSGDVLGTPQYLSPERLRDRLHRGDVRDDLWALAVTAYEVLTLHRPFVGATLEHIYRSILADEPVAPSRRRRELPRDLDAVLATALAKEPQRRYRSAADFAADLRAVRLGEAIRARPAGPWRRLVRWHRRHAAIATAGWLVLAALTSTVAVQQASLAEVRAAQAETSGINRFLVEKMLLAVTPEQARGREITAAQVFDAALADVEASFPEASRTSGTLHHVLGLANKGLGRLQPARASMERAVAIRTAVLGAEARETMASRRELIELRRSTDDIAGAATLLAELLQQQERVLGADDQDTLATRLEQVRIAMAERDLDRSERLARAALADHQRVCGDDHRSTLAALHLLARVLELRGDRAAAEPLMRDVLARRRRLLGDLSPATVGAINDLASLLHDLAQRDGINGHAAEAEALYAEGLELASRLHGPNSQAYATAVNNFASFLQDVGQREGDTGKLARAVELFRTSLTLREAIDGPDSSRSATALGNLGSALLALRDHREAVLTLERALQLRERLHGPDHPETVLCCFNRMMALGVARDDRAMAAHDDLAQRLERARGLDAKTAVMFRQGMLQVLVAGGHHERALTAGASVHADCLRCWPADGGPTGRAVARSMIAACRALGRREEEAVWQRRAAPAR